MKIGWGTGIAIFYTCFVAILLLALKKSKEFDHSLVVEDYYKHDLNYQSQFDKMANSQALLKPLQVKVDKKLETVNFDFPKNLKNIQGNIHFFRASDKSQDFVVNIRPNQNNQQKISTKKLSGGLWTIKVDWSDGEQSFYDEQKITL